MSTFKQRLGSALHTQLNFASTTSTLSQDQSVYSGNGLGATARKSILNASKLSGSNGNVLGDRVSRISEKINEIHVSLIVSC